MMGKSFLLGLLLAMGGQAQGLRYTQVCEVENAPTPQIEQDILKGCGGVVFQQGEQSLVRAGGQSVLTRSSKTGTPESIVIDHEKKEWRVLPFEKVSEEVRKNQLAGMKIQMKIEVRNLNPDREIEGMMAKGYEVSFGPDLEKMKGSPMGNMLGQFRVSQEIWVARDRKLASMPEAMQRKGVGASIDGTKKLLQEFLSMFDASGEALARLEEVPAGLMLEMTVRMPGGLGGNAKGMLMRTRSKDIVEEKISPEVFAIPEGYRHVE